MARAREQGDRLKLELVDTPEGEEAPKLALFAVDRAGETVHRAEVSPEGDVRIPIAALEKAVEVVVGPADAKSAADLGEQALTFHTDYVRDVIAQGAELAIPVGRLIGIRRCVDGSVERCIPYPFVIDTLVAQSQVSSRLATVAQFERSSASVLRPPVRQPFHPVCTRVCQGLVLVYRRVCCCDPWIVHDPRLDDLIDRLKDLARQRPPIKWPPGPDPGPLRQFGPIPDPAPIDQLPFFSGATLDEASLHAEQDYLRLESLSPPEVADYVSERAYLRPYWCHCGAAQFVGEGLIQPDGTFRVCWRDPFIRLRPGCHDEYAFVVRQVINGTTVTIYDGLAANRWFESPTGVQLVSYDRRAAVCTDESFPQEGGAFVVLEHIGAARSWRLKTPAQDTWDSVLPPVYNDGLLDPAPKPSDAEGSYLDSNWGGTLALHYHFSETMRATGARYYRISAVRADAAGNPTGSRTTLSAPLGWLYMEPSGMNILVQAASLGPVTKGSENDLYLIPYTYDHDWQDDQYHGYLDTSVLANDRYLVMLEVFDGSGNRLKPNGSSGPGNPAGFTFRRWSTELGPLDDVPFSALTHMFWWDNRPSVAYIHDLQLDGVASTAECQFLTGTPASTFSAGYRAYHENPMFIHDHRLWWHRGLGVANGTLVSSPDNAGQPPASFAVSPPVSFASMLGTNDRCSFSLNLHVNVKTNNGSGVLTGLNADDQAAFALED